LEPATTNSETRHGNTRATLSKKMVLMQQTILRMQSIDERTQSRKRKNDTHSDASHTLDDWTKKQLKISVAQQVEYDKQITLE
jgi:hypothetical protein